MRIRIQIQGFDDKNWKKFTAEKIPMRIRIQPTKINEEPDPQYCFLLSLVFCFYARSGSGMTLKEASAANATAGHCNNIKTGDLI
jgi:hypothetical protein